MTNRNGGEESNVHSANEQASDTTGNSPEVAEAMIA
jgi:hypothetical protein